jgi:hypothetical protein
MLEASAGGLSSMSDLPAHGDIGWIETTQLAYEPAIAGE